MMLEMSEKISVNVQYELHGKLMLCRCNSLWCKKQKTFVWAKRKTK